MRIIDGGVGVRGGSRAKELECAINGLAAERPDFSAQQVFTVRQKHFLLGLVGLIALSGLIWPHDVLTTSVAIVSVGFVVSIAARSLLILLAQPQKIEFAAVDDDDLPVYSVLVPLYREAEILPQLSAAIEALDYPSDKLDVLLVLEESDKETLAAARHLPFSVVVVPEALPRTKPKAANFAAQYAQGEFLVIFDAEDRPEPDQLRKAVTAFRANPNIACFQAHLTIDRTHNWLQCLFALDYGIWFNALLPGLERLHAPIPLGGTSNHFRSSVLKAAGLWDPFNVTEDADLGIRLARLRYRVAVLPSQTFEEAPKALGVWLCQRTRWIKGHMQTLLVHSRHPLRLLKDTGWHGCLWIVLFLGGGVWSALINPMMWAFFLSSLLAREQMTSSLSQFAGISGVSLLVLNALLAVYGVIERKSCRSLIAAFAYPFFWLMISIACYRALYQLIFDPFRWEKTPHGSGSAA